MQHSIAQRRKGAHEGEHSSLPNVSSSAEESGDKLRIPSIELTGIARSAGTLSSNDQ